jgi:hypothetical protein
LILLAAIRDIYRSHNDDLSETLALEYFGRRDRRTRAIVPKFIMNSTNDPVFQNSIVTPRSISEIRREASKKSNKLTNRKLLKAYLFLREEIEKEAKSPQGQFAPDFLVRLEEFLKERLAVIQIVVSDEADAFTLFETLNERGLELSVLDLLKNHLFKKSGTDIEASKRNWNEMSANLDDAVGVRFLRHYWVSRHGRVQAGRLFRQIRDATKTRQQATKLSEDLRQASELYAALSNSEHPIWADSPESTRNGIRTLRLLSAVQCYPVLLAAYNKLDLHDFGRVVWLMVVMAVRYSLVCEFRTGALEIRYAEISEGIAQGNSRRSAQVFKDLRDLYPSNAQFRQSFMTRQFTTSKHSRFLLRELEGASRRGQILPNTDTRMVNLEHIAPQTRNSHWHDIGDLKELEYDDWVHFLGNQVLLEAGVNKNIGGKKYSEKRKSFTKSEFLLTREVAEREQWTTNEIEARQSRLAQLASEHWSYEDP